MERRILGPREVTFERGPDQKLYFVTERGREGPVKVRWAFPLTNPDGYVVISDEENALVALLKDYKRLDSDSLAVVRDALEEDYFLPRITKIENIEDEFQVMTWTVQTDRGPRHFQVGSRARDIRWLNDHHVVITDVDGNRYEIADLSAMDPESQEKLEMEV